MSAAPEDPNGRIAALQAELDAVKRREAEYRANMVQEFLDRGERNTYLHTLREERSALKAREQEASADLEILTRKLEAELQKSAALSQEIARMKGSWSWRVFGPSDSVQPAAAVESVPGVPPIEGAAFTYFLHTSPFRVYRGSTFTLKGWAWPDDGRAIAGIRANLSGRTFNGRTGLEEPEVIARYGPQQANPRPGFEVTFETPLGRQSLSLEANIEGIGWRSILRTTIWCEAAAP
jgi:uncharacterized small protein (DUF1192 family)